MPRAERPGSRADSLAIAIEQAEDAKGGPFEEDTAQPTGYAGLMSAEDMRRFREGAAYITDQLDRWPIAENTPGRIRPLRDEWGRMYIAQKFDIPGTGRRQWARTRCFIEGDSEILTDEDGNSYLSFPTDDTARITIDGNTILDVDSDGLKITATKSLYLDGGGNTRILEPSADTLRLSAGGDNYDLTTSALTLPSGNELILQGAGGNLKIAATAKLYFDGGSNTYWHESSGDTLAAVVGGNTALTLTGTSAAFRAASSLAIHAAANPTVSGAGQIGIQTTDGFLNYYDGGAERALNPELSYTFPYVLADLLAPAESTMFRTNKALTITKVVGVVKGSSSPSVDIAIQHGTDRNAAGAALFSSSPQTIDSTTTGNVFTSDSFNDATMAADEWLWVEFSGVNGTVEFVNVTIFFRYDP